MLGNDKKYVHFKPQFLCTISFYTETQNIQDYIKFPRV